MGRETFRGNVQRAAVVRPINSIVTSFAGSSLATGFVAELGKAGLLKIRARRPCIPALRRMPQPA